MNEYEPELWEKILCGLFGLMIVGVGYSACCALMQAIVGDKIVNFDWFERWLLLPFAGAFLFGIGCVLLFVLGLISYHIGEKSLQGIQHTREKFYTIREERKKKYTKQELQGQLSVVRANGGEVSLTKKK